MRWLRSFKIRSSMSGSGCRSRMMNLLSGDKSLVIWTPPSFLLTTTMPCAHSDLAVGDQMLQLIMFWISLFTVSHLARGTSLSLVAYGVKFSVTEMMCLWSGNVPRLWSRSDRNCAKSVAADVNSCGLLATERTCKVAPSICSFSA